MFVVSQRKIVYIAVVIIISVIRFSFDVGKGVHTRTRIVVRNVKIRISRGKRRITVFDKPSAVHRRAVGSKILRGNIVVPADNRARVRIGRTALFVFRVVVVDIVPIVILKSDCAVLCNRLFYFGDAKSGVVLVFGNMHGVFEAKLGIFKRVDGSVRSAYGTPPPRKNRCDFRRISRESREVARDVISACIAKRIITSIVHSVCGGSRIQVYFIKRFKSRADNRRFRRRNRRIRPA